MEDMHRRLEDHIEREDERIKEIHGILVTIKDNHLAHIEPAVARLEAKSEHFDKMLYLILSAIVIGFIGALYQVISRR